jgi:tetratricopeptide (TPR) repeat protein
MEHKIKRDAALINLVSDFEAKIEQGTLGYIEDKAFIRLIEYYEEEYLPEKAMDVVDIALEQFKYRSDFYIIKAKLLLNFSKYDECLDYLEQAAVIAPFETEILLFKARVLALKKEITSALEIITDLKSYILTEDLVDVLIAESFVYESMKDFDKMYDCLAKAVKIDSNNVEAMERIWISAELSRRYADSVKLHLEIIDKDPYNYQAWYNLGHGYNCIYEYEKAVEALEYSFIINENFESGYLDCADTCVQIGNFKKALEIYLEANGKFGLNSELMINIANCYIKLCNTALAKQWLLKSIRIDAYNDEAYFLLGESYSKEAVWYNAINAYHKAIDLDNRREEYYLGLAKAYLAVEDYNKATINFQMATQTGPEDTQSWYEYACFLIKLGLFDEATLVLEEAEDYTFGPELMYCKAAIHYLKNDNSGCIEVLEEALFEDYTKHSILYDIVPEIKLDKEISGIIRFYNEVDEE